MAEGTVTAASLREQLERLGLAPADEDVAAAVPAVEALLRAAREIEALLGPDVEPSTTFRLTE